MAKYSYSYACGHGTGSVSLFGKSADRERKLAWYEQNMVCPECYKKQQAAADEAAEQVAVIKYRMGSVPLFSVVVHGRTLANKESLKALGFCFTHDEKEGLAGVLATKEPPKAWQKTFEAKSESELMEKAEAIIQEIAPLGYRLEQPASNVLDMAMLRHQWQKIAEKEASKPQYNGCFGFLKERHGADYAKSSREGGKPWNGKIYGRPGSYNYYVDDTKHSMTDEQKAAIDEYRAALQAWREQ